MRLGSKAALEKIATVPESHLGQPVSDRGPRVIRDLELDGPAGFLLDHGTAVPHPAAGAYVVDLQRHEIAAAQLAVYRQVEQSEVALLTLKLKP